MVRKRFKSFIWLIPVLVLVMITSACGGGSTEQPQDADNPTNSVAEIPSQQTEDNVEDSQTEPEASSVVTETTTEENSEEETTESEPKEEVQKLELIKYGFGQDGSYGSYAFIIENPNQSFSIMNTQFQIAIFDENGNELSTDFPHIEHLDVIYPGQSVGLSGKLDLDEGQLISKIEIKIQDGDPEIVDQMYTFDTENITYFYGEYSSSVTSVITNPYNTDLTNILVSAVLYDDDGNIIGGGFTYLDFILANSSTGVSISLSEDYGDIASVEVYPILSGLTGFTYDYDRPEDASDISIRKFGFEQNEFGTAYYGFLVENPNDNYALENSQYHMAGYSSDGVVLCSDFGTIETILPNQTIGKGGLLFPTSDQAIDYIEVTIHHGEYIETEALPSFTAENIQFINDEYDPQVAGTLMNPYDIDISDLWVYVIAYNDSGDIIGGGYSLLDFLPANGEAVVDASVTVSGIPASLEFYATVSSLSEIEE